MAQIDIHQFSGVERLPLRTRLSLIAAAVLGETRKPSRTEAAPARRLAGPVGREAEYLRDIDMEIGF